jgi:HEAT repeat protein
MGIPEVILLPVVYLLAGLLVLDGIVSSLQKKAPFWMTRQILQAFYRYGKQTLYLRRLLKEERTRKKSDTRNIPISSIFKAKKQSFSTLPEPITMIIQQAILKGSSLVVYGDQGTGKTTALRAAVLHTAQQAYRRRILAALLFIVVLIALLFVVPWLALLWVVSYIFWETLLFRVPLPLFLFADEAAGGTSILAWYEHQVIEHMGGKPLFHDENWVTLFIDGADRLQPHQIYSFLQDLHSYLVLNPSANVIVTVRPEIDLSDVEIDAPIYEMQPLDEDSVKLFIEWCLERRAVETIGTGNLQLEDYLQLLKENGLTGENGLGRNPYWLEIMIFTERFDRSKARLVHYYSKYQLSRILTAETHIEEVGDLIRSALAQMAISMQPYGSSGMRSQAEIQHERDSVKMILEGSFLGVDTFFSCAQATGLIELVENRKLKFKDPLLQDYFTAFALYRKEDWESVKRKAEDLTWWPAIFLLGGILDAEGKQDRLIDLTAHLTSEDASIRQYLVTFGMLSGIGKIPQKYMDIIVDGITRRAPKGFGLGEQQAVEQLVLLAGDEVMELFEVMYQSREPHRQLIATILLCAAGIPECDNILLNKPVQEALPVFQKLGSPAIEYLIHRLDSDDDVICYRASELLIALGRPVLDIIGNSLYHPRARVRRYVSRIIALISGEGAFQLLYLALADSDYDVWYQAADGLKNLGGDAQAILQRCADDPSTDIDLKKRIELILSAHITTFEEFVRVDAASDYDPDTTKVEGPSRSMGDPNAFQVLLKPGFRFGRAGRKEGRSLRQRPYQISSSGTGISSTTGETDEGSRISESLHFENMDFPPDFEQLLKRLSHHSVFVRSAAIEEVRKFGATLVPYLLKALKTDDKAQLEGVLDGLAEVANINSLKALRTFRDQAIDPDIHKKAERVIQRAKLRTM